MLNRKIHHTIFILTLIFLIFSCKKTLQKEESTVSIKVINPITEEPYPGVKYEIREYEDAGSSIFSGSNLNETEESPIVKGETNSEGRVNVSFFKKKNSDFGYRIFFDFTEMDVPSGDYKIINKAEFANLYQDIRDHKFKFDIVPYGNYYIQFKNNNCSGPSDKMRYRTKWLYTGSGQWSYWDADDYLEGCIDDVYSITNQPSDFRITEMEIIRNGQITYKLDTFYIDPWTVDTLKLYY